MVAAKSDKTAVLLSRDVNGAIADLKGIRERTSDPPDPILALAQFSSRVDDKLKNRAVAWFQPAFKLKGATLYIGPSISNADGRWERALIHSAKALSATGCVQVMTKATASTRSTCAWSLECYDGERATKSIVDFLAEDYTAKQRFTFSSMEDFRSNVTFDQKLGLSPQEFETCRELSHFSGAVAYDGPILSRIIREMLPDDAPLHFIDVGGKNGFLLGELILEFGDRASGAWLVESNERQVRTAARLSRWLQKGGYCGLKIQQSAVDEIEWPMEPCNVLMFVRSLWKVQRREWQTVLDIAWELLRPNGLLLVCENARPPVLVGSSDSLLATDELTPQLRRYGTVSLFSSEHLMRTKGGVSSPQSVFCVVRKNRQ